MGWWEGEQRPQAEQNSGSLRYPGEPGHTAGSCPLPASLSSMGAEDQEEEGPEEGPGEGSSRGDYKGLEVDQGVMDNLGCRGASAEVWPPSA